MVYSVHNSVLIHIRLCSIFLEAVSILYITSSISAVTNDHITLTSLHRCYIYTPL